MMIALALALAAQTPVDAALESALKPCRLALISARAGDPHFIERYIRELKPSPQERAAIQARCLIYIEGAMDGLALEQAARKPKK